MNQLYVFRNFGWTLPKGCTKFDVIIRRLFLKCMHSVWVPESGIMPTYRPAGLTDKACWSLFVGVIALTSRRRAMLHICNERGGFTACCRWELSGFWKCRYCFASYRTFFSLHVSLHVRWQMKLQANAGTPQGAHSVKIDVCYHAFRNLQHWACRGRLSFAISLAKFLQRDGFLFYFYLIFLSRLFHMHVSLFFLSRVLTLPRSLPSLF